MAAEPRAFLVGGYDEPTLAGAALARTVLLSLHKRRERIHLELACIHKLNTTADGAPAAQSLVVSLPSLAAAPSNFASAEPQPLRRGVQMRCMPRGVVCVATPASPVLTLPGFDPRKPSWEIMAYERMSALPDAALLQRTSTSPQHELPGYVSQQRRNIEWLLRAQEDPGMAEQEARYVWEAGRGYVECCDTGRVALREGQEVEAFA